MNVASAPNVLRIKHVVHETAHILQLQKVRMLLLRGDQSDVAADLVVQMRDAVLNEGIPHDMSGLAVRAVSARTSARADGTREARHMP